MFYQAPLYPYFLGTLYTFLGRDFTMVRIVQMLLGAGGCAALSVLAARLFGRQAGWIAGLLIAFYPPAIFFDGLLQKASLDLAFSCWLLLAVALVGARPTPLRGASLGLAFGCLILTRENALVLLPILVTLVIVRAGRTGAATLALVIGLAVILVPVGIRNLAVGGEFHLTTSQFGPNLFIGNNESATGTYVALRSGRGTAAFGSPQQPCGAPGEQRSIPGAHHAFRGRREAAPDGPGAKANLERARALSRQHR